VHGTYQGLDLELLDPGHEDERAILIEALYPGFMDARHGEEDVIVNGEPVNARLHVAMHQVVANQLLADDPPATWQTVQRPAGLGYDWHNIMHMIATLVTKDVHSALKENRRPDPGRLCPAAEGTTRRLATARNRPLGLARTSSRGPRHPGDKPALRQMSA
jgi:hypothetical protein